jgi:hypothetical protein
VLGLGPLVIIDSSEPFFVSGKLRVYVRVSTAAPVPLVEV